MQLHLPHTHYDQAAARSRVQTQSQRRLLSFLILTTILATSVLLTGGAFYYKEYMVHYKGNTHFTLFFQKIYFFSACEGKIHEFYYNTSDFYVEKAHGSSSWALPLSHPYHLLTLLCFCAGIILCPLGYGAIYR